MVTLRGRSFAARVAAGFLVNLGLDELVTSTLGAYEELALCLAMNALVLGRVRDRLWDARRSMPLFDVRALAGDLERAYAGMMDRMDGGPRAFGVPPLEM